MKKPVFAILVLMSVASVAHAICPIPSLTGTADQNETDQRAFEACQKKEFDPPDQLQLQKPQGVQQQPAQSNPDFLLDKNLIKNIGPSVQNGQEHLRELRAQESKTQPILLRDDKKKDDHEPH